LTVASPVIMPTFSGPRTWQRDLNWRARATSDFPEPVGGVEDDFVGGEEFEDGFFLVVVGLGVCGGEVVEEDVEDIVRGGVFGEILAAEPADT
jgi:hypothetical protein